jgi:hypothetical protein
MKIRNLKRGWILFLAILFSFFLISCGTGDGDGDGGTSDTQTNGDIPAVVPSGEAQNIYLSTSQATVQSGDGDYATITATVLDNNNIVVEGVDVNFSATAGVINPPPPYVTDAVGKASVTFSSGTSDPSNQVVTITATAAGFSAQLPIQIIGSTLTLSTDKSNITDDGTTEATLTVTARDAIGNPVHNIPVTLSVSGNGGADLSAYTGTTNYTNGEVQVTVTGTSAGEVTVTATGLGATGTQAYTVSPVGALFGITSPTTDPYPLDTGETLTITVNAPALSKVSFAASLGTLKGTIDDEEGQVIKESVTTGGTASAEFSSSQAGLATIQVFDPDKTSTSDTMGVVITAPDVDAARITLQSSVYQVAPSSGGISNTATLTATVRTSDLQVVGNAPVVFSIENPTGGGETVSPVVVYTNGSGVATTTFTSGSLPSVEPVVVSARVVGEGTTGPLSNTFSFNNSDPDSITRSDGGSFITDGFEKGEQIRVQGSSSNDGIYTIDATISAVSAGTLTLDAGEILADEAAAPGVTVTITAVSVALDPGITIGGTAGSVVIGSGSKITVLNSTTYALPMSVLVADSRGIPVPGAVVSLSAWPIQYSAGAWYDENLEPDEETFVPYISGTFNNEDVNENTFLDPGEDTNGNGLLTPHNSTAGAIFTDTGTVTVTTGPNGVADFDLVYLKDYAVWIRDRIRASTFVLGTETTSSTTFRLPYERSEGENGDLHDSPYPVGLTVEVDDITVPYTFPVFRSDSDIFTPIYGTMTILPHTYRYDDNGSGSVVGDVITDWITIRNSGFGTIVPVEINVK